MGDFFISPFNNLMNYNKENGMFKYPNKIEKIEKIYFDYDYKLIKI